MPRTRTRLNLVVLAILAPILILSGLLGVVSPDYQSTSAAPAYNLFHIVSGSIGLLLVLSNNPTRIRGFNVGFGLVDFYQAFASHLHLFPDRLFRWTGPDDALHIAIGVGLVLIGLYGDR